MRRSVLTFVGAFFINHSCTCLSPISSFLFFPSILHPRDFLSTQLLTFICLQHGFAYHHTQKDYCMLTSWLSSDLNKIPNYATHYIGMYLSRSKKINTIVMRFIK